MFEGKRSMFSMLAAAGILMTGSALAAGPAAKAKAGGDQVAILETSKGRMVVEFWDKEAPKTAANFRTLATKGFYNGTGFHRIIKGFMIQGGDPKSKNPKAPDLGTGDPGYKIQDEFNAKKHVKGVLSMANSGTPNSAGSQFFIMHGAAPYLDGKYTGFGRVIQGLDVLDAIANVRTVPNPMMAGEQSKPTEWVTLKSVKIVPRSQLASAGSVKAGAATGAGVTVKAATKSAAPKTAEAGAPASDKAAPAASTAPASESASPTAKDAASGAPADTAK